jgi:hypothetical protein
MVKSVHGQIIPICSYLLLSIPSFTLLMLDLALHQVCHAYHAHILTQSIFMPI